MAVSGAAVCSLVLLQSAGPAANVSGFLVGALAGPILLVGFFVIDGLRRASGVFGEWRWLPSRPTICVIALIGWAAGAAHVWFFAKEITRWLAG